MASDVKKDELKAEELKAEKAQNAELRNADIAQGDADAEEQDIKRAWNEDEEPEVPTNAWATAKRIWQTCKGMQWRVVVAVVSSLIYVGLTTWATAYSADVVDILWNNIQAAMAEGKTYTVNLENGGGAILFFFTLWTLGWLFYTLQGVVMASFAERLNLKLRNLIAAKLNRLPLSYFDVRQPGEIMSRATNDLDKLAEVMQRGLTQLIIAITQVAASLALMFVFNWQLALISVVFSAISLMATKFISGKTLEKAARRQAITGKLTGQVEEAYSGRAIIKAFGYEDKSREKVQAAAQDLAEASALADFFTNAAGPLTRLIGRVSLVFIAVFAAQMLVAGTLTVGVFQAFFVFVNAGLEPLTQMSMTISMLQGALAASERVFALLDEEEIEPDPVEPAQPAEPVQGHIQFDHVRFGYTPDKLLMTDVSLEAKPGQKVAIVGATGAGKTTLINLLMRFYEINGGKITLDGVDTHAMRMSDVRRQFGMVLQDAWLFEGSIAQNIAYGKPDATREEIVAAAKAARVDFFVRTLPHGYDTVLSNDAESVSQGQRQLLTIARAMLCDPAILILDEATSSVDTRTEQDIVAAMETLMAGRTSFVIAHRLSTIVDADLILVMDHGNIIEQGTHSELLAAGGYYAKLYQSQFA